MWRFARRTHEQVGDRMRRRTQSWTLLAFMVVAAGLSVVLSVHWTHPRTSNYGGLTVHHPGSWRNVGVQFITGAVVQPLGYLTNQRHVKQCRPDARGQVGCGPPVTKLNPGGVLISFYLSPSETRLFHPTGQVAGFPAAVTRGAPRACPPGASYELDATIRTPDTPSARNFGAIMLTACLGGADTSRARHTLDTMLSSATYQ